MDKVIQALSYSDLKANRDRRIFNAQEMKYIGHILNSKWVCAFVKNWYGNISLKMNNNLIRHHIHTSIVTKKICFLALVEISTNNKRTPTK